MSEMDERRKGVVLCERCRVVYTVWIRSDGQMYPISSHNNCSCGEDAIRVIE